MFHFYNPWNRQKTFGVPGGIEMELWAKMG